MEDKANVFSVTFQYTMESLAIAVSQEGRRRDHFRKKAQSMSLKAWLSV